MRVDEYDSSKQSEAHFGLFIFIEKAENGCMPDRYRVQRWGGDCLPDENNFRRQMAGEGYSVYLWTDGPGAVYGRHDHSGDQSHWVVSGAIELNVEGFGTVVLAPGDRDFLPAGTHHSARVVGDVPVAYLIGEK